MDHEHFLTFYSHLLSLCHTCRASAGVSFHGHATETSHDIYLKMKMHDLLLLRGRMLSAPEHRHLPSPRTASINNTCRQWRFLGTNKLVEQSRLLYARAEGGGSMDENILNLRKLRSLYLTPRRSQRHAQSRVGAILCPELL